MLILCSMMMVMTTVVPSSSCIVVAGFGSRSSSSVVPKWRGAVVRTSSTGAGVSSTTTQLSVQIPTIDEWTLLPKTGAVKGTVGNHPELPDGYEITTSPLQKLPPKPNSIVVTRSGSKYKLLTTIDDLSAAAIKPPKVKAKPKPKPTPKPKVVARAPTPKKKKVVPPNKVTAAAAAPAPPSYDLNGKVVGTTGNKKTQYLLVGKLIRSSSKRSQIYYAYASEDNEGKTPTPTGPRLTVKLSNFLDRLTRENKNYDRVSSKGRVAFSFQGSASCFVRKLAFVPTCDGSAATQGIPAGSCALILESGTQNLRSYLSGENGNGGVSGAELRRAAVNICRCLEAMHSSGLVWTDLKAENFVLTGTGTEKEVKGIDLESCVPLNANPEDYSPEATPPEFAAAEKSGIGYEFRVQKNYDTWSLGMLLIELATGRSYFRGQSEGNMLKILAEAAVAADAGKKKKDAASSAAAPPIFTNSATSIYDAATGAIVLTADQKEKITDGGTNNLYLELILQCLQVNPNKRPSITQILLHPYFLTTGLGPITFWK